MQLALSHLGYRPGSPKLVTLCPGAGHTHLPERIPFYLRQNCFRMPRSRVEPEGFSKRFPCPFDLLEGKVIPEPGSFFYQGELVKIESRWGMFWQADFTEDARWLLDEWRPGEVNRMMGLKSLCPSTPEMYFAQTAACMAKFAAQVVCLDGPLAGKVASAVKRTLAWLEVNIR